MHQRTAPRRSSKSWASGQARVAPAGEVVRDALDAPQVVVGVAVAHGGGLAAPLEPRGRVLAQALEHAEARHALGLRRRSPSSGRRAGRAVGVRVADLLGGGERAAALEDRQALEELPLGLVEQVVGPVDRGLERVVARGAAAAGHGSAAGSSRRRARRSRSPSASASVRRPARSPAAARRRGGRSPRPRALVLDGAARARRGRARAPPSGSSPASASTRSPSTPSGVRLVASTRSGPPAASSRSTAPATPSTQVLAVVEHEQPAPVRERARRRARARIAPRARSRPPRRARPARPRRGRPAPARTTSASRAAAASSSARRLLPAPPAPTIVTSRPSASSAAARSASRSRPTKRLAGPRHRRARGALVDGVVEDPLLERARLGVGGQAELGEPAGRARAARRAPRPGGRSGRGRARDARHLLLERLRLRPAGAGRRAPPRGRPRPRARVRARPARARPAPRGAGSRPARPGRRPGPRTARPTARAPARSSPCSTSCWKRWRVDLPGVDRQPVGRAVADEQRRRRAARALGLEERAQAREADRQRARRGVARVARPGRLDQLVGRHRPPGIEQQPRQHRALLAGPRRMRLPVVNHLQ